MQGTAYGTVKRVGDKFTLSDVTTYTADQVTPPDGVKSEEWIKGLKPAK